MLGGASNHRGCCPRRETPPKRSPRHLTNPTCVGLAALRAAGLHRRRSRNSLDQHRKSSFARPGSPPPHPPRSRSTEVGLARGGGQVRDCLFRVSRGRRRAPASGPLLLRSPGSAAFMVFSGPSGFARPRVATLLVRRDGLGLRLLNPACTVFPRSRLPALANGGYSPHGLRPTSNGWVAARP